IAYILPGGVCLLGFSGISEPVRSWIVAAPAQGPTFGGFLYLTLAALAAGLTVSAVRWLLLDSLHHLTGVRRPRFDDAKLPDRLEAFNYIVENHYRYYQFYSNTLLAVVLAYVARRLGVSSAPDFRVSYDIGICVLCGVLFFGSRRSEEHTS